MDETDLGPKAPGEYRIAHLSDLHISADRSSLRHRFRAWAGKSQAKSLINLRAVTRDMEQQDVDHLLVTGDLTNAAKDEEMEACRAALGEFVRTDRLTIVPGNHDIAYRHRKSRSLVFETPRKLSQVLYYFSDVFPSGYPPELHQVKRHLFPFVKILAQGNAALIGLDTTGSLSAKAGPLNSLGTISRSQFRELHLLLKNPWLHDRIKIVALHHHPMIVPVATMFDSFKLLFQSKQLLDLLYQSKVDLILHGHKHHPFCWQSHTYRDHDLTIICAGPPDAYAHGASADLVYNVYSIQGHRVGIHYRTCSPTTRDRTEIQHAPKIGRQEAGDGK
jgi:3',5'-cyclic AMP phosphodiesterase CpdA